MTRAVDTGFSDAVYLRQAGPVEWDMTQPLTYTPLRGEPITVPREFGTDGASVPRLVAWIVPRSGRYLPAAVVHDWCYRVLVRARKMTYRQADAVLLEAMRRLGVPALLRGAIWSAVRLAGLFRGREGRDGWWRDAPRVLAVTLIAAPIVVPVSAVVAAGLVAWAVVEWIGVVGLRLFGRRDRYVNPPTDLTRA